MDNKKIADRVRNMGDSATLKMAQRARDLTAQGIHIISLSLGEPDFDTPNHIKKAASTALENGYTKYTPVAGLLELRQSICKKLNRDQKLDYNPNQIVVSTGAKQCLANLSMSLLQEGDEAIILSPYWVSYKEIVELSGASCSFVHAEISNDYKSTPDQIEKAISPKTRMIFFSSPCNPTGSVYSKTELQAIATMLQKHPDILVVSDEIYEYINFTKEGHYSIAQAEGMKDRTIIVNGFSKGFAMTGWRLGYIAAPQWIADACTKIQGQFTSGAASFSQKAASVALDSGLEESLKMTEAFHKRKDLFVQLLSQIEGFQVNNPQGAFYLFPEISSFFGTTYDKYTIQTDDDFADYLLAEAHVAVVPGNAFGNKNCIRLSYSINERDIEEAVKRIHMAVKKLVK